MSQTGACAGEGQKVVEGVDLSLSPCEKMVEAGKAGASCAGCWGGPCFAAVEPGFCGKLRGHPDGAGSLLALVGEGRKGGALSVDLDELKTPIKQLLFFKN